MSDEEILEKLPREMRDAVLADRGANLVPLIEQALHGIQEARNRYGPILHLAIECGRDDPARSEALLREAIALDPGKPDAWIYLAGYLFYAREDIEGAERAIREGASRARAAGCLVRYAYGTMIRVALKRNDFATVERALTDLLAYRPMAGMGDVKLETDFIPWIPEGAVSADLIKRYVEAAALERRPPPSS